MKNETLEKLVEFYKEEYEYIDNNPVACFGIGKLVNRFNKEIKGLGFRCLLAIVADQCGQSIKTSTQAAAFMRALDRLKNARS